MGRPSGVKNNDYIETNIEIIMEEASMKKIITIDGPDVIVNKQELKKEVDKSIKIAQETGIKTTEHGEPLICELTHRSNPTISKTKGFRFSLRCRNCHMAFCLIAQYNQILQREETTFKLFCEAQYQNDCIAVRNRNQGANNTVTESEGDNPTGNENEIENDSENDIVNENEGDDPTINENEQNMPESPVKNFEKQEPSFAAVTSAESCNPGPSGYVKSSTGKSKTNQNNMPKNSSIEKPTENEATIFHEEFDYDQLIEDFQSRNFDDTSDSTQPKIPLTVFDDDPIEENSYGHENPLFDSGSDEEACDIELKPSKDQTKTQDSEESQNNEKQIDVPMSEVQKLKHLVKNDKFNYVSQIAVWPYFVILSSLKILNVFEKLSRNKTIMLHYQTQQLPFRNEEKEVLYYKSLFMDVEDMVEPLLELCAIICSTKGFDKVSSDSYCLMHLKNFLDYVYKTSLPITGICYFEFSLESIKSFMHYFNNMSLENYLDEKFTQNEETAEQDKPKIRVNVNLKQLERMLSYDLKRHSYNEENGLVILTALLIMSKVENQEDLFQQIHRILYLLLASRYNETINSFVDGIREESYVLNDDGYEGDDDEEILRNISSKNEIISDEIARKTVIYQQIEKIKHNVREEISDEVFETSDTNPYFSEDFCDLLCTEYLTCFALWSAVAEFSTGHDMHKFYLQKITVEAEKSSCSTPLINFIEAKKKRDHEILENCIKQMPKSRKEPYEKIYQEMWGKGSEGLSNIQKSSGLFDAFKNPIKDGPSKKKAINNQKSMTKPETHTHTNMADTAVEISNEINIISDIELTKPDVPGSQDALPNDQRMTEKDAVFEKKEIVVKFLPNRLLDDIDYYIKTNDDFVVATIKLNGKKITLTAKELKSVQHLIDWEIFDMFVKKFIEIQKIKNIHYLQSNSRCHIERKRSNAKMLIGVDSFNNSTTLTKFDTKENCITFFYSSSLDSSDSELLELKASIINNIQKKYKDSSVTDRDLEGKDGRLEVLCMIINLIDDNFEEDINDFGRYVCRQLLIWSEPMKNVCVICSIHDKDTRVGEKWSKCCICKRWFHDKCVDNAKMNHCKYCEEFYKVK